jgi:hypothetical protein
VKKYYVSGQFYHYAEGLGESAKTSIPPGESPFVYLATDVEKHVENLADTHAARVAELQAQNKELQDELVAQLSQSSSQAQQARGWIAVFEQLRAGNPNAFRNVLGNPKNGIDLAIEEIKRLQQTQWTFREAEIVQDAAFPKLVQSFVAALGGDDEDGDPFNDDDFEDEDDSDDEDSNSVVAAKAAFTAHIGGDIFGVNLLDDLIVARLREAGI